MANAKIKPTAVNPKTILAELADAKQRDDAIEIMEMMQKITGEKPKYWGHGIIGFGKYHYKYESGHEGDCCVVGFSPRKGKLSIYLMAGVKCFPKLLDKLGKHKTSGQSCLYVKTLDDIDRPTLRRIIKESVAAVKKKYK